MIIVQLLGGLGNQLFQYALGHRLALQHNTILKLDNTAFNTFYNLHKYSLHHFNVRAEIATEKEIKQYKNTISEFICKVNNKLGTNVSPLFVNQYFKERAGLPFDPHALHVPANTYLEGYFQSEKFFVSAESSLRKEFSFKTPANEPNQKITETIIRSNAISLHVRRADYVTDAKANAAHGACTLDYYSNAIQHITANVASPHFFVFSDDITWAKENIKLDFPVAYIDFNDASKNYEDLRLMSLCKHNIIANSSFSWWGAWLNNNAKKIVIAPKKWFNDPNRNAQDIVPERWVRI